MSKYIITGGAGFIGSHMSDKLLENGHDVLVIDDLSSGTKENLAQWKDHEKLQFLKKKLRKIDKIPADFTDAKAIFHFAALPSVRVGIDNPDKQWKKNVVAIYNLLKKVKQADIPYFVFSSSSTVYGVPQELPTPEDHPLQPISVYGGTKVSCESLLSGFSHTFDIRGISFRFANIMGPRISHGVVYDFVHKLRDTPQKLKILGDGTQNKSYLHVFDLLEGILQAFKTFQESEKEYDVYNVGNKDRTDVMTIAEIVADEMGLTPEFNTTGGVEGGRGWKGDVKEMLLDISKIREIGWEPKYSSDKAVRMTANNLITE